MTEIELRKSGDWLYLTEIWSSQIEKPFRIELFVRVKWAIDSQEGSEEGRWHTAGKNIQEVFLDPSGDTVVWWMVGGRKFDQKGADPTVQWPEATPDRK